MQGVPGAVQGAVQGALQDAVKGALWRVQGAVRVLSGWCGGCCKVLWRRSVH